MARVKKINGRSRDTTVGSGTAIQEQRKKYIQDFIDSVGTKKFQQMVREAPDFKEGEANYHYEQRTKLPMALVMFLDDMRKRAYEKSDDFKLKKAQWKANEEQENERKQITPEQQKKLNEASLKAFMAGASQGLAEQTATKAKKYIDNASMVVQPILKYTVPTAGKAYSAAKDALDVGYNLLGIPLDQSNYSHGERTANRVSKAREDVLKQGTGFDWEAIVRKWLSQPHPDYPNDLIVLTEMLKKNGVRVPKNLLKKKVML